VDIKMATEVFEKFKNTEQLEETDDEIEIGQIDSSDEEIEEEIVSENEETDEKESEYEKSTESSENKFNILLNEFREDLLNTFPELEGKVASNEEIKKYCGELFPKMFFDLLYENEEIFNTPQFLLPNIDFSILMKDSALSGKTKKTIWKYLQLILFTVVENINSKETSNDTFGNASKLFEAIKEDELHEKLTKTMEEMRDLFSDISGDSNGIDISGISESFDADKMKDHLEGLMGGKIGNLAREIAEEAANEIGADFNQQEEFMKTMMKNPNKIFDLIKNVGNKLENKINSGEVNKSELLEEASELFSKMQDMPGMKDMLGKMSGMTGKMDFKAMANKLQETLKMSKTKERLNKKREERAEARKNVDNNVTINQKNENMFVVNVDGTKQEKSKIKKNDNKNDNNKKKKKDKRKVKH
jgi:hypothetical protein